MTLNSCGPISLAGTTAGQSIEIENGGNGTTQISLNCTAVRTLAGVPSGAIIMPTNFYGKSNAYTFNATISSNTTNYCVRAAAVCAGWPTGTALKATVTINSGVYVYGSCTGNYGFKITGCFPAGSTISVINNGYILGHGGTGGTGVAGTGGTGGAGGPALYASYPVSLTNNNVIGGGGGGGGAGAGGIFTGKGGPRYISGSGGGGGIVLGSGGSSSSSTYTGTPGGAGSLTAAGSGGPKNPGYCVTYGYGGAGGPGGGYGSAGSNGSCTSHVNTGFGYLGPGGAGGAGIVGNSYITYVATGTIYGSIS